MSLDELDDLLALERAYDDLPDGADARILAGIEGTLGGGGDDGASGGDGGGNATATPHAGASTVPTATSAAPWLARAAYVAVGIVTGASGHAVLTSHSPSSIPAGAPAAVLTVASAVPTAPASTAQASIEVDAAPTLAVKDLPDDRPRPTSARPAIMSASSAVSSAASSSRSAEERAELDVARTALARGRIEACLEALQRHERTYGEGQLAEEREVLAVQALVSAGRKTEAAERARRFQKKYPNSLFGPAVAQTISAGN